jgi:hypothetical protein
VIHGYRDWGVGVIMMHWFALGAGEVFFFGV